MSHMEVVWAEIDSMIKSQAERLLEDQGMAPSEAIRIFYQEVVTQNGLPFTSAQLPRVAMPAPVAPLPYAEIHARDLRSVKDELWSIPRQGSEMLELLLKYKEERAAKKRARAAKKRRSKQPPETPSAMGSESGENPEA